MAHLPHIYVPPPWPEGDLSLSADARHHLAVLRRRPGSPICYTDGAGTMGEGTLMEGVITRGQERTEAAPRPAVTVAVAPPRRVERARWLVEKLGELGVARLAWLRTAHTEGRPPRREKVSAWAIAALQQSRGGRLLSVDGPLSLGDLDPVATILAERSGGDLPPALLELASLTLVVGPEGGFASQEPDRFTHRLGLGPRTLRTETAAIVGAAMIQMASQR